MPTPDERWDRRLEESEDRWARHPKKQAFKYIAFVVGGIIAINFLASLIATGGLFWQAQVAKITAQPRVTKSIYSTENIISKVALFHDRCTGVQEKLGIFRNNYGRYVADREAAHLQTDPLERRAAIEGLVGDHSDVTAALNAALADARAYNSAAANPTIAPFRTIFSQHGLPERIELPAGEAAANTYQIQCG